MQILHDRRALHQIPELGHQLPETVAYLTQGLAGLGCRLFSPIPGSLCAFFDFGRAQTVAFRSDADALPIAEGTGADYASRHPGCMHACGHDGHMAMLLELARRLSRKQSLPNNVLLVFQPDEETTGGARDLCETGLFAQYSVIAIFGLHLWPGLTAGEIFSRPRELMARSCEVNIDIFGRSAHIAKASQGLDALAAGVELYRRAVAMEQALPEHIFRLLKFGRLESGTVRNAVPAHTRMEGSLRAFQDDVFLGMQQGLRDIARAVEAESGCRVEIAMSDGYPAVLNPEGLYHRACRCARVTELAEPFMTAEDFSWYQRYLPGAFFFLGAGEAPALHADTFDFDETILEKGADFLEALAERFRE